MKPPYIPVIYSGLVAMGLEKALVNQKGIIQKGFQVFDILI